jgi:hypothetical protein
VRRYVASMMVLSLLTLTLAGCGGGAGVPRFTSSAGTTDHIPTSPPIVTSTYPARSFAPSLQLAGQTVVVTWMANTDAVRSNGDPGISGYQVLRGMNAASLLPITGIINTTTFRDLAPPAGGYVHYAIRAAAFQLPDGMLDGETQTPAGLVGNEGEVANFGQASTANEILVPSYPPVSNNMR